MTDSGNGKDTGRRILKILSEKGWTLQTILCTHAHADHIGGNRILQERTGCRIYGPGISWFMMEHPELSPTMLYGGYPAKAMKKKSVMAQTSVAEELTEENLPKGLSMLRLDGHSPSMVGIRTDDDVWFLADSLVGEKTLAKYHVSFLSNVEEYLCSLDVVSRLEGRLFIPDHGDAVESIQPMVLANRDKLFELLALVKQLCQGGMPFGEVLKGIFDHYGMELTMNQYVMSGSAVRTYLSYLLDQGEMETVFRENRLYWKTVGVP